MVEAADAVGPTLRHFVLKAMPKGFGRACFDPKLEERLRPVTTVLDPTTLGGTEHRYERNATPPKAGRERLAPDYTELVKSCHRGSECVRRNERRQGRGPGRVG